MVQLTWNDIEKLPYEERVALYLEHKRILESGNPKDISEIAHLHVLDLKEGKGLEDPERRDLENILAEPLREELYGDRIPVSGAMTLERLREAPTFQRLIPKATGKAITGRGANIECTYDLYDDLRVRTFTTEFATEEEAEKAVKAQIYFHKLADYARATLQGIGTTDALSLAEKIARVKPAKPLRRDGKKVTSIFVTGQDGQDYASSASTPRRVKLVRDLTDMHLVLGYFSPLYEATKEGRELTKDRKGRRFGTLDYDLGIVSILIARDESLRSKLISEGLIAVDGRIPEGRGKEVIEALKASPTHREIIEKLHVDNVKDVLSPWDKGLGNVMINGTYCPVDFETMAYDSLTAVVPETRLLAGVRENYRELNTAVRKTLGQLRGLSLEGAVLPDDKQFFEDVDKLELRTRLRVANRYANLASNTKNVDLMKELARYFGNSLSLDVGLDFSAGARKYLCDLFGGEIPNGEFGRTLRRLEPWFAKPGDVELRDDKVERQSAKAIGDYIESKRRERTSSKIRRWVVGGLAALTLIGGIAGTYLHRQQEQKLTEQKERITELSRSVSSGERLKDLLYYVDETRSWKLEGYKRREFDALVQLAEANGGSKETAYALLLDGTRTMKAIQSTGSWNWERIREEDGKRSNYPTLQDQVRLVVEGPLKDNWMRMSTDRDIQRMTDYNLVRAINPIVQAELDTKGYNCKTWGEVGGVPGVCLEPEKEVSVNALGYSQDGTQPIYPLKGCISTTSLAGTSKCQSKPVINFDRGYKTCILRGTHHGEPYVLSVNDDIRNPNPCLRIGSHESMFDSAPEATIGYVISDPRQVRGLHPLYQQIFGSGAYARTRMPVPAEETFEQFLERTEGCSVEE